MDSFLVASKAFVIATHQSVRWNFLSLRCASTAENTAFETWICAGKKNFAFLVLWNDRVGVDNWILGNDFEPFLRIFPIFEQFILRTINEKIISVRRMKIRNWIVATSRKNFHDLLADCDWESSIRSKWF